MVNVLNVSRSGYYAWRKHGQTVNPRKQRQIERDEAIKQAFIDSKERNGARRIQVDLAELDMTPDIKTVRNSMIRQALYLRLHVNLRSPRTVSTISLRSEEHTSELQSRPHLVCRLLLEKKKKKTIL